MITIDELATPFFSQHRALPVLAKGLFGGAFVSGDCSCGWEGTSHTTAARCHTEWRSHRNAMRKLSDPQARYLRTARAQEKGIVEMSNRSGAAMAKRGLVEMITSGIYRITPVGRGVLLEHDRLSGAAL